jgi:hypothetical protein
VAIRNNLIAALCAAFTLLATQAHGAAPASGPRQAALSWTAPTLNTDGSTITLPLSYNVYGALCGQAKALLHTTSSLSALLTGQPIGEMCYQVTAVAGGQESAPSGEGRKIMRLDPPSDGMIEAPTDGGIEYPQD